MNFKPPTDSLPHIKRVSRVKHAILERYLPPWATILGSTNRRLNYFDCFAGPGRYELEGVAVDGSPLIAVKSAKDFLTTRPNHSLNILLTEKNKQQAQQLEQQLGPLNPYPSNLHVELLAEDSKTFIPDLLASIPSLAPSFFMIDPYGHPLTLPVINDILSRPRTEALITLMWYRINMDLGNAAMEANVDRLFGNPAWRRQTFMTLKGVARENAFLEYFISHLNAKYILPFRIGYDPEDRMKGERTKYYLLHASNHPRAVLLMKEVMWPLGDEDGTFDFSGESQGVLISRTPQVDELRQILLREFAGREVAFDDIRAKTWKLPFVEKHYREVIQQLHSERTVRVTPVSSKKSGLRERDLVRFPNNSGAGDSATDRRNR
ncbi:MAG: three-Cys-motif partner protein TcmP [Acidobacteriales bacterium]|nr:three-Cys-motif partner protein TcmP [Terriglobales bacterium]